MRLAILLAAMLLPLTAFAQTAPAASPAAPAKPPRQTFREHFDSANTTHDGHLTLDQAKEAKWTAVVRRFDKMDANHKGFVTAQDIYNEFARERAEKAKATGTAPSATAGSKS